jgi:hypothetical protein
MSKRDTKGRFSKTSGDDSTEEANRPGLKEEINFFGNLSYFLWRALPFALLIFIVWRYFKISKILTNIFIEIACGEGCKCDCTLNSALNSESVQAKKNSF